MTRETKPPNTTTGTTPTPTPAGQRAGAPASSAASSAEVADFVAKVKALGPAATGTRGRLLFAMDATMSRAPTWDMALALQSEMFRAVKEIGSLEVQLMYFRGAGEARASRWVTNADALAALMRQVACHGGFTQIGKVLSQARRESEKAKISALVYVGDAVEEPIDELAGRAGELALLGVPAFLFQEGGDANATRAFKEIARLTKGAHCHFGPGSAAELRELLTAVAVYAAGGQKALQALLARPGGEGARRLLGQMRR
ncbi:VWA domain-containing protein [uncultured Hyphomicrobium sp.]|uniref:VWA domain-containing protein n=1 Tax=uncultured Hyphomicrobium sp. TaxID=194373 RepID=UPI0025DFD656|nr:VWA domain-containing protein [uncultured Hyphomicrobium sp.]